MSAKHAMDRFSCGFVHKRIGRTFSGLLTGGFGGGIAGALSPDPPTRSEPARSIIGRTRPVAGCPDGFEPDGRGGCNRAGIVGAVQRFLPGGSTGTTVATTTAPAAFGIPTMAPFRETRLVLDCGPGWVLGMDSLCYPKKMIPNKFRKWPRGTKPFLTGGEVRTLRRAKSLEKRFKRLSTGKNKLF